MAIQNKRSALVCVGLVVCNVLVHAAAQGQDVSFEEARNFTAGNNPLSVAVGDFNSDGQPDLAVANDSYPFPGTVSVLLGNADGSFQEARNFAAGSFPSSVAVGDFNGDGRQDLVVTNFYNDSNEVSVLFGNGDGTFQAPRIFIAGNEPDSVAVGDFNGDGVPDLAVANFGILAGPSNALDPPSNVSVLLGNGDGTFQAARNFGVGVGPHSVAVGDFNGDGLPDLAVGNLLSYNVSVLLGNGDGTFQAARNFAAGSFPSSIAVGDFNGDGLPDLAVANQDSNDVSVLLGNGDGTFEAPQNFAAGNSPASVAVSDFNGDGVQDLAVANGGFGFNNVSVLLGNGDGTFQAAVNFGVGRSPRSIAVGDFNGDGAPDLATVNNLSNNVSVLINNTGP